MTILAVALAVPILMRLDDDPFLDENGAQPRVLVERDPDGVTVLHVEATALFCPST